MIGATPAIGEGTARIWAAKGARLILVRHNVGRLDAITKGPGITWCGLCQDVAAQLSNDRIGAQHLPMVETVG